MYPINYCGGKKYTQNGGNPSARDGIPLGEPKFATLWKNLRDKDNPCEFVVFDNKLGDYDCDSLPVPPSLLAFPFFDKCCLEMQAYGVINHRGDVNLQAWGAMKNALLRPHWKAQRNQARSEQRQEEKEVKKRRLERYRKITDLYRYLSCPAQSTHFDKDPQFCVCNSP
ncbi:hypothetical protein H0H87_001353 [Tephrocybe sp. NHM501043]|nr:hypothetical protein H0H87_001353 [Tephrocybe sp. NHM501043]